MDEKIRKIPGIALRGLTVLPGMVIHFDISRKPSIQAVEEAMEADQEIFLVAQKDDQVSEPTQKDLYEVGVIAKIKQVAKLPKDILRVMVEGKERVQLVSFYEGDTVECQVEELVEEVEALEDELYLEALLRNLKNLFKEYVDQNRKVGVEAAKQLLEISDIDTFMKELATHVPFSMEIKQKFLEAMSRGERFEILGGILQKEAEVIRLQKEIQAEVKVRVDKNQREYLLREQLKYIKEELGEENTGSDADTFLEETESLKASDEVKEKLRKEIKRYKGLGNNSAESGIIRNYIETVLSLPWDKVSEDNEDLNEAEKILKQEHYGLKEVKERILEFLAVRLLTKGGDSPILCLVGPPGTGKTSIARSVAHALNKKYVRISLGGVRDEAEIRGHRRTYIGSMPGRIVYGIKEAGVKNPLMLLDEIDKVSSDYKGDTAAALLEVLDSEQNNTFKDHYLELPLDLSEVLFIATANDLQTIPRPLLDRMEVIQVSSYTENEKLHIAEDYLLPKQVKKHGLREEQLSMSPKAMKEIIHSYTRESGVRNLERRISQICRKSVREILQKNKGSIKVTERNLEKYLGHPKYTYQMANTENLVGIVRGLAWTSVGGDTLEIEVNVHDGKGEFVLTGQLGDVMKESATTAISYIRSILKEYEIPEDFFKKHDIHIHIPQGAVPKDGPSAGITMATAILSAITKIPVYANVAMTGEISLRGRVLPIGGLKEKLLAAKQAGMKKIVVPYENRMDVEELSKEIVGGMEFTYAKTMSQVLPVALVSSEDQ